MVKQPIVGQWVHILHRGCVQRQGQLIAVREPGVEIGFDVQWYSFLTGEPNGVTFWPLRRLIAEGQFYGSAAKMRKAYDIEDQRAGAEFEQAASLSPQGRQQFVDGGGLRRLLEP